MKKKTAQPRPKQRKTSESEKKKGLIAQKKTTGSSERAKSALDNRSHRTYIGAGISFSPNRVSPIREEFR